MFCKLVERAVWRTDGLYLLLDTAPVAPGHALIVSRDHYMSAADMPAETIDELDKAWQRLRSEYLIRYGQFAMFEHGRTGHCVRLSGSERMCDHMHVHVLPLSGDLAEHVEADQRTQWDSWHDVTELASDLEGYMVVYTEASGKSFWPVTTELPSHYLRTKAAELLGQPALADWEEHAVGVVRATGRPIEDVADELGIDPTALRQWVLTR